MVKPSYLDQYIGQTSEDGVDALGGATVSSNAVKKAIGKAVGAFELVKGELEMCIRDRCHVDERFLPCIDFGHLNSRTFGSLRTSEDFGKVFERMENCLGSDRMRRFHSHFSKIEYTEKGGEKRHLTFADTVFGPDFEPLAEWIVRKNCSPTVICESAGTQAEDALAIRRYYESILDQTGENRK